MARRVETVGNDLTPRALTDNTQARTWVDRNIILPAGKLIAFKAYIQPFTSVEEVFVRFQIWQPVTIVRYKLFYQKRFQIDSIQGILEVSRLTKSNTL